MAKSNPNKANQFVLDPRQKMCWDYYINPDSPTFANALQSAVRAGYEKKYANQITVAEWFLEKLRRSQMFNKAEKNLERCLDMPIEDDKLGDRVLKASMFVTERLGKAYYSQRQELTGQDGSNLVPVDEEIKSKIDNAITNYLNDHTRDTK